MALSKMHSSSSVAALLLALLANQAAAQEAAPAGDEEAVGTNEIIVTAQKRSENINSVPLSITAVSGDDLQAQGVTDVAGLVKVTPGFNAINSGFGTPVYFLRGIGFFDSSLAAKPTVTVYTDEVPIPYSVMTAGASFDLERVEVLKGPQGTLFGSNATGGAINYISAKPTWTPEAGLALSYGRFNRFSVEGYASGPLSDTLAARISLRHEGGGDWQKSYTRDASLGQRAFTQGRVQLAFRPVDTVRLNLMVNAYQDHGDTQAPQFTAPFQQSAGFFDPRLPTYPVAPEDNRAADWGTSFPLKKDNWQVQAALRGEIDVSDDITLTSISAYTRFKEAYGQESDGTTLRLTDVFLEGDIKSFSQELRLAGSLMGDGSWIFGGNYEWGKTHELLTQRLNDQSSAHVFDRFGFPSIELVPQLGDTKYRSIAAFADVSVPIADTLTLIGGVRYTDTKVDFSGCTLNAGNGTYARGFELIFGLPSGTIPLGGCVTFDDAGRPGKFAGSLPEDNLSWRGVLQWKPAEGQLFYASVSRGYKSGSFATLAGNRFSQYKPVRQEQVTAYELGFKSALLDRRVQINGALFYYDYLDKQLKGRTIVPVFGPLEALVNVPKSRIKGAELQLVVSPVEGLRANLGATYIDSKVTRSFSNYTAFGAVTDFNGFRFPYTPKWQVNADLEYRWDVGGSKEAFIGANYTYRSSTYGDFKPDARLFIDDYGLLDLRAGIGDADGAWTASLYAQNVTNEYYWNTAARRGDAVIRFTGMPVTYGVNVGFKFR